MTTVYLDARFALDLAVNYCLLACAARLDGGAVRRRRLALAAGLGAGYGVLTLLPGLGALGHPVGAALAAAGMLLAAYGPSDRLLRRGALFLVLSCAFGGVLVLVSLARGSSAGAGGLLGPSLGMRGILIAAALSYGALSLVLGRQFAKTQAEGGLCPLTLTKGEKTLRLLALIDTGNTLRDPLTGEGVVVLDCGRAGALVPELAGVPAQAFQRPVELLARVRSQLRRYLQLGGGQVQASTLIIGGICLDDNAKTVTVDGDPVALTRKEYDILRFVMRNVGTVLSPNEIYRRVWEDVPLNAAGAIAVHIRHLREKLEINPSEPRYIKVVWGKGYKMEGGIS